jgi:hypothetical protein
VGDREILIEAAHGVGIGSAGIKINKPVCRDSHPRVTVSGVAYRRHQASQTQTQYHSLTNISDLYCKEKVGILLSWTAGVQVRYG